LGGGVAFTPLQFLQPPASEFSGSAPDKANEEKVTAGEKWRDKTK